MANKNSQYDSTGGYPGKEQNFVISLHSSKAIMVEEINTNGKPKYKYAYADAVIQLAIGSGKKEGVSCILSTLQYLEHLYGSVPSCIKNSNMTLTFFPLRV